jgi:NAD(P)-dependent dehydrogenase (short-subunit alcohol dehydrogenase family)
MSDELAGRRALVTGGSRGMGAAIARRLRDAGATVLTTARPRARRPSPRRPGAEHTIDGGTVWTV